MVVDRECLQKDTKRRIRNVDESGCSSTAMSNRALSPRCLFLSDALWKEAAGARSPRLLWSPVSRPKCDTCGRISQDTNAHLYFFLRYALAVTLMNLPAHLVFFLHRNYGILCFGGPRFFARLGGTLEGSFWHSFLPCTCISRHSRCSTTLDSHDVPSVGASRLILLRRRGLGSACC